MFPLTFIQKQFYLVNGFSLKPLRLIVYIESYDNLVELIDSIHRTVFCNPKILGKQCVSENWFLY